MGDPSKRDIDKNLTDNSNLVTGNIHSKPINLEPTAKNDSASEEDLGTSNHGKEVFLTPSDIQFRHADFNCTPSDDQCVTRSFSIGVGPTLTPDDGSPQQAQHLTWDSSFEVLDTLGRSQNQHFKQDPVDKMTMESSIHSPQDSFDSRAGDSSGSMAWDSSCDILTVSTREPAVHLSFHQDGQLAVINEDKINYLTPKADVGQTLLTPFSSRNRSFSPAHLDASGFSGRSDVYTTSDEM